MGSPWAGRATDDEANCEVKKEPRIGRHLGSAFGPTWRRRVTMPSETSPPNSPFFHAAGSLILGAGTNLCLPRSKPVSVFSELHCDRLDLVEAPFVP